MMDYQQMWNEVCADHITKKKYRGYIIKRYQPIFGAKLWRIEKDGNVIQEGIYTFKEARARTDEIIQSIL